MILTQEKVELLKLRVRTIKLRTSLSWMVYQYQEWIAVYGDLIIGENGNHYPLSHFIHELQKDIERCSIIIGRSRL